jgi:hypothetical protein
MMTNSSDTKRLLALLESAGFLTILAAALYLIGVMYHAAYFNRLSVPIVVTDLPVVRHLAMGGVICIPMSLS